MAEEVAGIAMDGVHNPMGNPFKRDCPEEVAWQLDHAGALTRDTAHAACDLFFSGVGTGTECPATSQNRSCIELVLPYPPEAYAGHASGWWRSEATKAFEGRRPQVRRQATLPGVTPGRDVQRHVALRHERPAIDGQANGLAKRYAQSLRVRAIAFDGLAAWRLDVAEGRRGQQGQENDRAKHGTIVSDSGRIGRRSTWS